jgi:hypothetical protein
VAISDHFSISSDSDIVFHPDNYVVHVNYRNEWLEKPETASYSLFDLYGYLKDEWENGDESYTNIK